MEFNRISQLSAKISNLLGAVRKNHGQFAAIDKDLLAGYTRELYELVLAIQAVNRPSANDSPFIKRDEMVTEDFPPETNGSVIKTEEARNGNGNDMKEEHPGNHSTENAPKKSIAELYAEKNDKSTLNEKYKKQGAELADKLKQTPIQDLRAYIGLNKRFTFINSLFNGDEEHYEKAVKKVNSSRNYEEAILFVQTELISQFSWKTNDPLVADFFYLILRRYLS